MATVPDLRAAAPDAAKDEFGVLVGWSHAPCNKGIQLKVQSLLGEGRGKADVAARHYLMTRNQALALAKYLLDATGQTLPPAPPGGRFMRLVRRMTGG